MNQTVAAMIVRSRQIEEILAEASILAEHDEAAAAHLEASVEDDISTYYVEIVEYSLDFPDNMPLTRFSGELFIEDLVQDGIVETWDGTPADLAGIYADRFNGAPDVIWRVNVWHNGERCSTWGNDLTASVRLAQSEPAGHLDFADLAA